MHLLPQQWELCLHGERAQLWFVAQAAGLGSAKTAEAAVARARATLVW